MKASKKFADEEYFMNPEFPILNLNLLEQMGRTAQIESYNFSMLLFTKDFQELIKQVRQSFAIPPEGIPAEERMGHFKTVAKSFHKAGLIKNKNDPNQVVNMVILLIEEWLKKHTDYGNKNSGKKSLLIHILYDYIISNDPFTHTALSDPKDQESTGPSYGMKFPLLPHTILDDNIEIHIGVYFETTKDEVKQVIDSAWEYIEKYKKGISRKPLVERVKDPELLKIKWQAYHMHKIKGMSHREIAVALNIGETKARKIVSDVKKDITKLKGGKLLP